MTISSSAAKAVHLTSPAVSDYTFPFKVFKAEQLKVSVVDAISRAEEPLILDQDYSVSGFNQDTGGTVALTPTGQAKAGDGNRLAVIRNMGFTQDIDYRPHDVFPAETHERALDILTMQDQELLEMMGRAVIAPVDQQKAIQYSDLLALRDEAAAARDAAQGAAASAGTDAGKAEDAARAATVKAQAATDKAGLIMNLEAQASTLEPALCLTGCGGKKRPPCAPALPPAVLMQTVPEPRLTGQTNADLLGWALELRGALRLANEDKKALREWADK